MRNNVREKKTASNKKGNRNGKSVREAKRLLEEVISMMDNHEKVDSKMIKTIEQNKILSKNQKLTGKLTRGLRLEDITYLKKLAYSMTA